VPHQEVDTIQPHQQEVPFSHRTKAYHPATSATGTMSDMLAIMQQWLCRRLGEGTQSRMRQRVCSMGEKRGMGWGNLGSDEGTLVSRRG
jgi:hypothetical protein